MSALEEAVAALNASTATALNASSATALNAYAATALSAYIRVYQHVFLSESISDY